MENASAAFLDAVRKSMRAIRRATGSTTITPELLTSAEKLRYESAGAGRGCAGDTSADCRGDVVAVLDTQAIVAGPVPHSAAKDLTVFRDISV